MEKPSQMPEPPQDQEWEKDKFSVALNDYGNFCLEIAMDWIKSRITTEQRDKFWRLHALEVIDLHKSLLESAVQKAREEAIRDTTYLLGIHVDAVERWYGKDSNAYKSGYRTLELVKELFNPKPE